MSDFEIVHTISDWYDGARAGVADLRGEPHYFQNEWLESEQYWSDIYFLTPLDVEMFELAKEDWEIWLRWEKAFNEGRTTHDTHPTLPEDRQRHREVERFLVEHLVVDSEASVKATAEFVYGQPTKVRWNVVRLYSEAHPVR